MEDTQNGTIAHVYCVGMTRERYQEYDEDYHRETTH